MTLLIIMPAAPVSKQSDNCMSVNKIIARAVRKKNKAHPTFCGLNSSRGKSVVTTTKFRSSVNFVNASQLVCRTRVSPALNGIDQICDASCSSVSTLLKVSSPLCIAKRDT